MCYQLTMCALWLFIGEERPTGCGGMADCGCAKRATAGAKATLETWPLDFLVVLFGGPAYGIGSS